MDTAPAHRRVVVIGYGSPIRGDDALGPLVADRLRDELSPDRIAVHSRHILTAELVGEAAEASLLIFLDAACEGRPGELLCRRLVADASAVSPMAHFMDPRELLAWIAALYGRHPEAHLVTAVGATFDYAGYELSATATAAIEPMIATVRQLIDNHLQHEPV